MIFDILGLPRVNGATDKQDSAMLAGLMTVFEWHSKINLLEYVQARPVFYPDKFGGEYHPTEKRFFYVRHPEERLYDFSRDQFICLIAGLSKTNKAWVKTEFMDGSDILSPAALGHVRRCQGKKSNWFYDAWLWLDVWIHAKLQPLNEPNQLLCMMMVADKKYLRWWVANNKQWYRSITKYWCSEDGYWRNESELAKHMIMTIHAKILD